MKKQRTHLTPEEVQEFINLGVDFGETTCVWVQYTPKGVADCIVYDPWLNMRNLMKPEIIDSPNHTITPAPNLQEVLEVLPTSLYSSWSDYQLTIEPDRGYSTGKSYYSISYQHLSCSDRVEYKVQCEGEPLTAAADILRWVCKNHPETITKTE